LFFGINKEQGHTHIRKPKLATFHKANGLGVRPPSPKEGYKVFLPTKILRLIANGKCSTLSKSERLILPLMATNADKHTGEGALSIGSISRLSGLCRNTAKNAYRSLVDRGIIRDNGNTPGNSISWCIIHVPDATPMTPYDTVKNCRAVLIENNKDSTKIKDSTSTLDGLKKPKHKYPKWWDNVLENIM